MKPTFELYDFVMEDAIKDRGIKKCGVIHFARRANGSWIDIPVMIASGKKDGPILLVDACHHGDEHEGAEGIIRVFNSIDPQKMRGTLVAIPVLNVDAFAELRRYGTQDMVPLDLNRSYPGNDTGSLTKCIADFYFTRFIKKATAVITIHGGGNYLYLEPITDYMHCGDEVSRISQEMAEAFGIEKLWQIDESEYDPKNGIMDENAYSVQVPVILPEIGGQVTRLDQREKNIDILENGIINVMKYLNILEEDPVEYNNHLHLQIEFLFTKHGGIHKPMKKGGERVKKGETLAIVTDLFGNEIDKIVAPYDCVVEGYWAYSVALPRGWSYVIGKEVSGN